MPVLEQPDAVKKRQTLILIGCVGGLVLLVIFGLWLSDPNKGKPTPREVAQREAEKVDRNYAVSSAAVTAEESWIAQSESELSALKQENKDLHAKLQVLETMMEELRTREPVVKPSSTAVELPPRPSALPPPPPPPAAPEAAQAATRNEEITKALLPPAPQGAAGANGQNPVTISVVSLSESDAGEGAEAAKNVASYLPTGAFSTAALLSGLDAPTGSQAQSQPVPVLLRLMDVGQLPNFFNSDIKDCHVVGAGWGEISSERAHIRLETLSCVLVNGDVIETPVKGYVAGEDGKAGMRGRLVEKRGQLIAKSLLAGIFSGAGTAIESQYQQTATSALGTVTSINPDRVVEAGLATGLSTAMDRLAQYYIERANEMYPIIEVDANRLGEIVLTGGADLGRNLIGNTRDGAE